MIDRDVRLTLLHVIDILTKVEGWITVKEIIDCLEVRMMRRYDRRAIYGHLNALNDFMLIEIKHIEHNTKLVRWIPDEHTKRWNRINFTNNGDFREAL